MRRSTLSPGRRPNPLDRLSGRTRMTGRPMVGASTGFEPYREWYDRFIERYEGFSSRLHVDETTGHGRFEPMPDAALLNRFYNGTFERSSSTVTPEAELRPEVVDIVSGMLDYVRETAGLPEDLHVSRRRLRLWRLCLGRTAARLDGDGQ